ncbi:hypothetical protein GLOTRDRAFT_110793 [Gloeophyllum trabeum ATCC 11539]|uniref:Uncharacterized protein n=1 Tax=Gloeophyllum trabeum (strain ATCC 11539 / FP-39264 / Madison 617) TaxID=670483 RepID=S7QAL2_GLOTA|nr:uncharacterized protein GLOTRDRAFT_110793 [Gloeophyllum trabeum ATCC 11539]EPQ56423.1 hypothetical protein GLOTRDRAFT_110793 [Gloeophyllum trabeum ATCC 11539]
MNSYPTTSSMDAHDEHARPQRHSIDQALELERELDSELSPPTSPTSHRPQSLDPAVLASIVTQLRIALADVSQERDELASQLSEVHSRESILTANLEETTDKCTRLQSELEQAQAKIKDDEEAISMLRAKVEESRRGLMKLQSESRRMSSMTLDMSRANAPMFGGPSSSNKRASFTPLTGSGMSNGHRRISSVSDSAFMLRDFSSPEIPGSPGAQTLSFPDPRNSVGSPPSKASRRSSGFWSRPPPLPLDESQPASSSELAALQREVKNLKSELEETRAELTEAKEGKEASETCVKALRDFIAQNGIGGQADEAGSSAPLRLPLPPSMSDEEEARRSTSSTGSGWGFKLWKVDTNVSSAPSKAPSTVLSPSKTVNAPTPQTATPLARKLGGFFSSRSASVSSVASTQAAPEARKPQTPYAGSDVSSMEESTAEPISPASEVPQSIIMIQDERTPSSENFGAQQIAMTHIAPKGGMDPISV